MPIERKQIFQKLDLGPPHSSCASVEPYWRVRKPPCLAFVHCTVKRLSRGSLALKQRRRRSLARRRFRLSQPWGRDFFSQAETALPPSRWLNERPWRGPPKA